MAVLAEETHCTSVSCTAEKAKRGCHDGAEAGGGLQGRHALRNQGAGRFPIAAQRCALMHSAVPAASIFIKDTHRGRQATCGAVMPALARRGQGP
jgi:hypothetical protein